MGHEIVLQENVLAGQMRGKTGRASGAGGSMRSSSEVPFGGAHRCSLHRTIALLAKHGYGRIDLVLKLFGELGCDVVGLTSGMERLSC